MKKLTKIGTATFGLALGVTTLCGHPLSISNVLASSPVNTFNIPAFETEFSGHSLVDLPFATDGTNSVAPTVYTQSGVEVSDSDTTDNKFTFAPDRSVYKVVYNLNGVDKSFIINVNLTEPKVALASDAVIPSHAVKDSAINIPYPTITDKDGEALLNALGEPYTEQELKNFVTIVVTAPSGAVVSDTDSTGNIGTLVNNNGVFTLTPKAYGDYTVKYTFKTNNTLTGELKKTINVSSTFNTEREITYSVNGSMPSVVLGVESTLPKVTVNDKTNDLTNIEAKVTITAKYIKEDGTYSESETINDYKFTPKATGDYIITYNVEDYYGNQAESTSYVIRNVKDSKAPQNLTVVDAYDVTGDVTTDEFKAERVNVAHKIPSKVATGTEVTFPAIYAEDNVTALADLTFVRNIKVKHQSSTTSTTLDAEFNENATYTFANPGTYVVTYSATDGAGKTTSKTFEIIVADDYVDQVKPKITSSASIAKYYKAGDVIKFNKPTAVDYNDADNKVVGDARVNVQTFWYQNDNIADKTLLADKNGVIEFTVPSVADGTTITFYTEVADTFGNTETRSTTFTVINDATPATINLPVITSIYAQGDDVVLPNITVTDGSNVDTVKSVSIEVYNKYGNKMTVQNVDTTTEGNTITISNASFKAINSGEYSILCVVTDMGDNITVASQKIEVTKTSIPVLKLDKESVDVSLGETVDLNIFNVYDEGAVIEDADVQIAVSGGVVAVDNTFTATKEDRYEVVFTYAYDGGVLEQTLVVNVSDNDKPVLQFVNGTPNLEVAETGVITLPSFDATDNAGDVTLSVSVTFKGDDDEELEVTTLADGYSFTADAEGTYEVIYKAVDNAGNETTKSYTIIVGDKTGPEIEFDEAKFLPTTMKLGSVFSFDMSEANVHDAVDATIDYKDVIVKLTDPDGTKVGDNDPANYAYSFNMDKVGTYKITYTVTDSKNNKTTLSQSIEVSTETKDATEKNDVGMVLAIIASLAVLAGVIIYFFKPEKRRDDKLKK